MRSFAALVALGLCAVASLAQEVERPLVQDIRPLMIAAIDSRNGESRGVLDGEAAQAITRTFNASAPIFIDISTERRYQQAGCSRLKVAFWQDGVLLPGAASASKQSIVFGINYCRDGSAPRSLQ